MFCPHCGAKPAADARFCQACGRALDIEAITAAPEDLTITGATGRTPKPSATPDRPRSPSSGWLASSDSISHGRFAPGTLVDGRYRIIGLLARGGMGEVYRADDLRLGQPVALKFLPDAVGADPVRLAQFHNEVRTARQISHPNICRVYDIGEIDGQLFLSMEFVDGEDLATSLRRIGRLPEDRAIDLARQLCAGLAAAHQRGVLHRDLKPANVMLDGAGTIRLMDFGLAAVGAVENVRAGTPAYMAPEQLLGREVTARSDIYALALVLYELFTGRRAFTASTLHELVDQHQSGQLTPPREIVSGIDPAVERAILRCLDPDPAKRPPSALAVAAALPGGDPLAAALAAGETPSPAMVAAAGEGAGLSRRAALSLFALVLALMPALHLMALRTSPLERVRPEYNADVLAQKARDAIRDIGYPERPRDEAYGFSWDEGLVDRFRDHGKLPARWQDVLAGRPSALRFWYRRSQQPMTGAQFHHDLLTPGIVTMDDPPPIESGMIQVTIDHLGYLTAFEAIPQQVEEPGGKQSTVDWSPILKLAGLEPGTLQTTEPLWTSLAASDTRAAWTGVWPGTTRPLRVEAAALRGRAVAFMVIGEWTQPWRQPSTDAGDQVVAVIVFLLAVAIIAGGSVLATKNLRQGRGDRAGALRLGCTVGIVLWAIWICQTHVSASIGTLGSFLIAVCTTVFYVVAFWAIYLALEPFVRRYWPQTLVSWTTLLGGRARDPIVGRDVLIGIVLGVLIVVIVRSTYVLVDDPIWPPTEPLLGVRATIGELLMRAVYATRSALAIFFMLFLLRVVLRQQLLAAVAFVFFFSVLEALGSDRPLAEALSTCIYFSLCALAVLRWGLTSLAVGLLVAELLLIVPITRDLSAWYVIDMILVLAAVVAMAAWALYTSVGGQLVKSDALSVQGK